MRAAIVEKATRAYPGLCSAKASTAVRPASDTRSVMSSVVCQEAGGGECGDGPGLSGSNLISLSLAN